MRTVLGCMVLMTPGASRLDGLEDETVKVLYVVPVRPGCVLLLMMMVVACPEPTPPPPPKVLMFPAAGELILIAWVSPVPLLWARARRCCLSCCSIWAFIRAVVCGPCEADVPTLTLEEELLLLAAAAFSAAAFSCLCFSNLKSKKKKKINVLLGLQFKHMLKTCFPTRIGMVLM